MTTQTTQAAQAVPEYEVGYRVTVQLPGLNEPARIFADGMPTARLAYEFVEGIVTRHAEGRGHLPRMTEIRVWYVWPTGRIDPVSLNWIQDTPRPGQEVDPR
jgi:hypothetical protein